MPNYAVQSAKLEATSITHIAMDGFDRGDSICMLAHHDDASKSTPLDIQGENLRKCTELCKKILLSDACFFALFG